MNEIDSNKVLESYEIKAKAHNDINAVLDAGNSESAKRANLLHDYFSKKAILKYLQPNQKDIVLDFGTGVGRLSSFLSNKVGEIHGIDNSPAMLAVADNSKKERGDKSSYHLFDLKNLPFDDKKFNKVFSYWVLASINDENLELIFSEINRCLSANGYFYFFEQVANTALAEGGVHKKRTSEEYTALCLRHDFEIIKNEPIQRMPSYAIGYWKKLKFLPEWTLSFFYILEKRTLNRKKEHIDYTTNAFVCRKK